MIRKIIGVALLATAAGAYYLSKKKEEQPSVPNNNDTNTDGNKNGSSNNDATKIFVWLDNPNDLQFKDMVEIYKERTKKEGKMFETIFSTEALIPSYIALKQGEYWERPENRNREDRKVVYPEKYVTIPRGTRFKAIIAKGQTSGVPIVIYSFNAGDGYPNNPIWHPILLSNVKEYTSSNTTKQSELPTDSGAGAGSSFGMSGVAQLMN